MTIGQLFVKLIAGILTFYFIISEINHLITVPLSEWQNLFLYNFNLFLLMVLKLILIFLILPALYVLKLLDYLGFGEAISQTWRTQWHGNELLQVKIFYEVVYAIIFILIIIKLIEQVF